MQHVRLSWRLQLLFWCCDISFSELPDCCFRIQRSSWSCAALLLTFAVCPRLDRMRLWKGCVSSDCVSRIRLLLRSDREAIVFYDRCLILFRIYLWGVKIAKLCVERRAILNCEFLAATITIEYYREPFTIWRDLFVRVFRRLRTLKYVVFSW